ncbi:MAG: DUF481 domain-containing protein [Gammaproteobacteria bacterium]|nr:DUF481 domain-containing protein [Gammaproteobacteria bacterium]
MTRVVALLCVIFVQAFVVADDGGPWSAKAGLGFLSTSGNSDTTNLNASLNIGYDLQRWHHKLGLLVIGAESNGVSTAERYVIDYKAKWDLHDYDYIFGGVNYDKDKFSGVDSSLSETIGYGRRILNNDVHVLNAEIGIGFRQQDFADGTDDSSGIIKLAGDYQYTISETSAFTQTLSIEIGGDNTFTQSVSGINAKLRDALALVFSFTIKNNSDVPAGLDKTDTFTAINLEYTF